MQHTEQQSVCGCMRVCARLCQNSEFTCWFFCHLFSYLGKQWAADRIHFSEMMEPPQVWPELDVWRPRGEKGVSQTCITSKRPLSAGHVGGKKNKAGAKPRHSTLVINKLAVVLFRGTHLDVHLPWPRSLRSVCPTHDPVLQQRWSAAIFPVNHDTYSRVHACFSNLQRHQLERTWCFPLK